MTSSEQQKQNASITPSSGSAGTGNVVLRPPAQFKEEEERESLMSPVSDEQTIFRPPAQLQAVAQLETKIKHTVGTVPFGGKHYIVGKKMEAKLDPEEPVKGSATTADNYDWMKGIRAYYKPAGVIRGHLLNHDLGGYGVPENLYPISSMANSQHSDRVEQNVKGLLTDSAGNTKNEITYSVEVDEQGPSEIPYESADFICNWTDETGKAYSDVIESRLNIDKGWGGKSASAKKSPSKWRHGSRRGNENLEDEINDDTIEMDVSALGLTKKEYGELRDQTVGSGGIDDIQDWNEALNMLSNEIDELASASDPVSPPEILEKGADYHTWLINEVAEAKKNGTLAQLTNDEGERMMSNLIAIRKERIYQQEGIDEESNIADEEEDVDMD